MSNATNALEELIGDHLLRTATWSKPTDIYVGLFTRMPGEDGTGGLEVSGGGYARVKHGPGDSDWTAPVGGNGTYSNYTIVQFNVPTTNWGDIVGFGLFSASSFGTLFISKAFTTPVTINAGDIAYGFGVGSITITFA